MLATLTHDYYDNCLIKSLPPLTDACGAIYHSPVSSNGLNGTATTDATARITSYLLLFGGAVAPNSKHKTYIRKGAQPEDRLHFFCLNLRTWAWRSIDLMGWKHVQRRVGGTMVVVSGPSGPRICLFGGKTMTVS